MLQWLSGLYGGIVRYRNARYDSGQTDIIRMKIPVFSVGNLSTGGTGKSPFVQMLARMILSLGKMPAIVSRGYGRDSGGEVLVSDGETVFVGVEEAGDELAMHAAALPVPIIAHTNRAIGAQTALDRFGVHAILLDDGFQHRRLYRDCDIVLVDKATLEWPFLLPAGRLREPLTALRRADVICAVGGVHVSDIPQEYCSERSLCIEVGIFPESAQDLFTGRALDIPEQQEEILAVAGIAHPERFLHTLKEAGYKVVGEFFFADHIRYTHRHIRSIIRYAVRQNVKVILTTEKDAVKLRQYRRLFLEHSLVVGVLPVGMKIVQGEQEFRHLVTSLLCR